MRNTSTVIPWKYLACVCVCVFVSLRLVAIVSTYLFSASRDGRYQTNLSTSWYMTHLGRVLTLANTLGARSNEIPMLRACREAGTRVSHGLVAFFYCLALFSGIFCLGRGGYGAGKVSATHVSCIPP